MPESVAATSGWLAFAFNKQFDSVTNEMVVVCNCLSFEKISKNTADVKECECGKSVFCT